MPKPSDSDMTTPMVTSRPLSFSPSAPMATPAANVSPSTPHSGDRPKSAAPVAPAKAI